MFSSSFIEAVIVECIYVVFGALESGVAESILYETYELNKCTENYEYLQAKTGGLGFVISILYSVSSGYLVEYMITLPVILDLVVCILSLISSIMLLEDNKKYDTKIISLPNLVLIFSIFLLKKNKKNLIIYDER